MPATPYSYRILAMNSGGPAPYSPLTTTFTWSQVQQWLYENYGGPEAVSQQAMTTPGADGTLPLLRFAFNLSATDPMHVLQNSSGYPSIWLNPINKRLTIDFVRRKASMNPGIWATFNTSRRPAGCCRDRRFICPPNWINFW